MEKINKNQTLSKYAELSQKQKDLSTALNRMVKGLPFHANPVNLLRFQFTWLSNGKYYKQL